MRTNLDDGYDEVITQRKPTKPKPIENIFERQFVLIVEGLQIEYAGKVNSLIDLCADTRFIEAKKSLYSRVGKQKAEELLHNVFQQ